MDHFVVFAAVNRRARVTFDLENVPYLMMIKWIGGTVLRTVSNKFAQNMHSVSR
jgi:hypothetical protein